MSVVLSLILGFNTASGKHCYNYDVIFEFFAPTVSIPQAVSTVTTKRRLKMIVGLAKVSIPQAVSTVTTRKMLRKLMQLISFNTASGKHCYNSGS